MYSPDELGNELAMAPASGKLNFHSGISWWIHRPRNERSYKRLQN